MSNEHGRRLDIELRVAAVTEAQALATSIVKNIEEGKRVILSCIGVPAVNQAVKAVAIANGQTAPGGMLLTILPAFHITRFKDRDTQEDVERTVMRMTVYLNSLGG